MAQLHWLLCKCGGNKTEFIFLEHNMTRVIEGGFYFITFQNILNNINAENIANLRFSRVRGYNFVCSVTPKQSDLVYLRKVFNGQ